MCTLIALHRCLPGLPLAIAANRDEFLDRPAEAPALRRIPGGPGGEAPRTVLAPRDARAGGTWWGLNGAGVFAAVTNRACPEPDPSRRSRGLLVLDVLCAASADDAAERLLQLEARAYNPFNLFVADRERAFAITYEEKPHFLPLAAGVHVIGNADLAAAPSTKVARIRAAAWRAAAGGRDGLLPALAAVCRSHDGGGSALADTCVHASGYGTRSSTLLLLSDRPGESVLRYADGPPCEAEYVDSTPLLHDLDDASGLAAGAHATRKIR